MLWYGCVVDVWVDGSSWLVLSLIEKNMPFSTVVFYDQQIVYRLGVVGMVVGLVGVVVVVVEVGVIITKAVILSFI